MKRLQKIFNLGFTGTFQRRAAFSVVLAWREVDDRAWAYIRSPNS